MNRQVQKTGVRKYFGADLVELQSEPLAALDAFFAEYGPCIVQGCGITDNEDGTHDIAPGLVALTGTDPEGVQRVMVMPFAGASGVALPLYLTAQAQVVERVYGDGKVKPVAHAYTAQAAGVLLNDADGEPLPHLTLTAEGGNRFVDAVQDTAHRFISDAERSKWNRILEQAKAYADSVATTGSAAALRSAKEYTDTRETAILAQADTKDIATLRTAKEYADQVVAALVDGSPEALNTLQELAAALGGDPNFATTVMQLIGERATMAQVNAALAGLQKTTIRLADGVDLNSLHTTGTYDTITAVNAPVSGSIYIDVIKHTGAGNWVSQTVYTFGSSNAPNRIFHRNGINASDWSGWVELLHSGNFDPAGKADRGESIIRQGIRNSVDDIKETGYYFVTTPEYGTLLVIAAYHESRHPIQMLVPYTRSGMKTRSFDSDAGTWSPWVELLHTGNFDPAGKANVTGSTANDFKAAYYSCSDSKTMGIAAGNYSGALNNNDVFLMNWDTVSGSSALLSKEDPYFMRIGEWAKRPLWHSGNLGLATAAADGLMAAADKQKLDSQPRTIWGSVSAGGVKLCGNYQSSGLSGEYIQIIHGIGHTSYSITATAICNNDPAFIDNNVTIFTKTATYCLIAVSYGGATSRIERAQVDFTIVY